MQNLSNFDGRIYREIHRIYLRSPKIWIPDSQIENITNGAQTQERIPPISFAPQIAGRDRWSEGQSRYSGGWSVWMSISRVESATEHKNTGVEIWQIIF